MRNRFVWAALGLQLLVLLAMAAPREWALHFGQVIFLRTAPVDPRDVMRGDYVRLEYEISTVPREQCRDGLAQAIKDGEAGKAPRWHSRRAFQVQDSLLPPDTPVYAVLKRSTGTAGTMELDYLTDRRPKTGAYLRGRLERVDVLAARVRYGLEAYFMQQGDALDLERSQAGTGSRAPLEMEVALGRGGLSVLKGHRRGPLEIGLDLIRHRVERASRNPWQGNDVVVAATIRLRNASRTNLAVVVPPDGSSFALVPDLRWGTNAWRWAGPDRTTAEVAGTNVVLLEPGATHRTHLNLTNTEWWVAPVAEGATTTPRPVTEITNTGWPPTRFRFEYRPPSPAAALSLPHAAEMWHGRLLSPAFSPQGNVD